MIDWAIASLNVLIVFFNEFSWNQFDQNPQQLVFSFYETSTANKRKMQIKSFKRRTERMNRKQNVVFFFPLSKMKNESFAFQAVIVNRLMNESIKKWTSMNTSDLLRTGHYLLLPRIDDECLSNGESERIHKWSDGIEWNKCCLLSAAPLPSWQRIFFVRYVLEFVFFGIVGGIIL